MLALQRLFSCAPLFWGGGGHGRGIGRTVSEAKKRVPGKNIGGWEGGRPVFERVLKKKSVEKQAGRSQKDATLPSSRFERDNRRQGGAVDRRDPVGSAGVQEESLSLQDGAGSFSMGSGRTLVSPEVIDDEGDRVFRSGQGTRFPARERPSRIELRGRRRERGRSPVAARSSEGEGGRERLFLIGAAGEQAEVLRRNGGKGFEAGRKSPRPALRIGRVKGRSWSRLFSGFPSSALPPLGQEIRIGAQSARK